MSDLEDVIRGSQRLEETLKKQFNATGKGLGELTKSLETSLPPSVVRNLDWIVKVRNKITHEIDAVLKSRTEFDDRMKAAELDLDAMIRWKQTPPKEENDSDSKVKCWLHRCSISVDDHNLVVGYQLKASLLSGIECNAAFWVWNGSVEADQTRRKVIGLQPGFVTNSGKLLAHTVFLPDSDDWFSTDVKVSMPHNVIRETNVQEVLIDPFVAYSIVGKTHHVYRETRSAWWIDYSSQKPRIVAELNR